MVTRLSRCQRSQAHDVWGHKKERSNTFHFNGTIFIPKHHDKKKVIYLADNAYKTEAKKKRIQSLPNFVLIFGYPTCLAAAVDP